MADQTAAPPFNEQEFQRWVVTSPWFSDLAVSQGLDTDEMKAMLARQIFNDPEYDFRGMYTHNLSPTFNGDNIVLPRSNGQGQNFLSPDAQIGDFFNVRFGVPQAFFGADTESALRNATALGLLPGYSVPSGGSGNDRDLGDTPTRFAESLSSYAADNPVTPSGPDLSAFDPSKMSIDMSNVFSADRLRDAFSLDNIRTNAINGAAGFVGNALAGVPGGMIASAGAQYAQGASPGKIAGSTLGGLGGTAFGGPLGGLIGSWLGGLLGDKLGGRDAVSESRATTQGTFSGGGQGLDANGQPISGLNFGTIGPNGITSSTSMSGGGAMGGSNNDGRSFADGMGGYGGSGGFGNDTGSFSGSHSNDDNASDHNSTPGW